MATWSDLLRKLGIGDEEEDEFEDYKPMASENKAAMASLAIEKEKEKPGSGSEYMRARRADGRSMMSDRDEENMTTSSENMATGDRNLRRALEIIKKKKRGMTDAEAEKVLEEFGGINAFMKSRNMASEEEYKVGEDTIRKLIEKIRKDEMGLDEY